MLWKIVYPNQLTVFKENQLRPIIKIQIYNTWVETLFLLWGTRFHYLRRYFLEQISFYPIKCPLMVTAIQIVSPFACPCLTIVERKTFHMWANVWGHLLVFQGRKRPSDISQLWAEGVIVSATLREGHPSGAEVATPSCSKAVCTWAAPGEGASSCRPGQFFRRMTAEGVSGSTQGPAQVTDLPLMSGWHGTGSTTNTPPH